MINCFKFFLILFFSKCSADPFPIGFCVPECKIIDQISPKTNDFAKLIPGDFSTYVYQTESEYYEGYQSSYYAITKKKGGWDCLRHYEILANGCIPYFLDLDKCDPQTMFFLPKELILEAMNISGVSEGFIDHEKFDKKKYFEILEKLLVYTREILTTKHMAQYVFDSVNYKGSGKILFLSGDPAPDYLRCLLLIGFKELLGERVVDFIKIPHVYKTYENQSLIYGKGFTYSKILDDLKIDRGRIKERIKKREFDLIIYGSIHRGLPFYDLVTKTYDQSQIVYLCGEDDHNCQHRELSNFFLREF